MREEHGKREVIIPKGVMRLPGSCFAGCSGLTVTLPDTIKTIDPEAFKDVDSVAVNCTSRRIALVAYCAGVQNIALNGAAFEPPAETAFEASGCQFTVTDDENLSVRLVKYVGENQENLEIPKTVESPGGFTYTITEIGNGAFDGQSGLTGILRIPDTVMEIGEYCFQFCSGLTGIKLPEDLKFMGWGVFAVCGSLTGTLYIPESLSVIPDGAFFYCGYLTGLVLPDSVTEIGATAFCRCDSLSRIQIGKGLNQLGESAFRDGATLIAYYSERIWQLLAENTSRLEEGSLVLLWDGKTDIPTDIVVSVQDAVVVDGSVTIGVGAVLTIEPGASVTVAITEPLPGRVNFW